MLTTRHGTGRRTAAGVGLCVTLALLAAAAAGAYPAMLALAVGGASLAALIVIGAAVVLIGSRRTPAEAQ